MAPFCTKHFNVLFFLSLTLLIHSITKVSSAYCPDTAANYTSNSTFQTNLNLLLASLSTSAPPRTRFANDTEGQGTDQVFGLAQCDPGDTVEICQTCWVWDFGPRTHVAYGTNKTCLNEVIKEVVKNCPNKRSAAEWVWKSTGSTTNCFLRYSDTNFISTTDTTYIVRFWNTGNASEPERFIKSLGDLLNDDANKAAFRSNGEMFMTGEANWTSFTKLYSLVSCTRDLSGDDCYRCLTDLFGTLPSKDWIPKGGGANGLSCRFRYDLYPFYTLTTTSSPSPPISPTNITAPPPLASNITPADGNPAGEKNKNTSKTVLIITILVVVVACLFIVGICIWLKRRNMIKYIPDTNGNQQEIKSVESLLFDLGVLRAATNNFSEELKLGEGGFGTVYKGELPDGQEIAVKRLSRCSGQGLQDFRNEAVLVAKLQHKNLVRLLGYCLQEQEKLLVYEYLPNLSLDKLLFGHATTTLINWETRYKIIEGITRGLLYLHEDSRLKIVHRDLKASNILLDKDMLPKISDFGLAKLFDSDQSEANTSKIAGTYGYMAPEYVINGMFSTKSDVYSYGVLILEIVAGRKNSDFRASENSTDLLSYTWKHWNQHIALQIVDRSLGEQYQSYQVLRCIHIGLLCVQEDEQMRPTMSTVVLMLNSNSFTLPSPSVPAFFPRTEMRQMVGNNVEHSQHYSVNDVSISDLEAR